MATSWSSSRALVDAVSGAQRIHVQLPQSQEQQTVLALPQLLEKVHEMRCRSRCVLENGRLKSVTGGLHNHQPHTDKIEKIVQRNKLAAVGCTGRKHSRTNSFVQEPKEEHEEEFIEEERQLASSEAAALHLTDHELMHASLMLIPE